MPVGRISCSATTARVAQLVRAGRRRDEHRLPDLCEELVEAQRPVVERRRQPEAEVDERLLARAVALVHATDLGHGLVRLVDEADEVGREVVEQRVRRRARPAGPRGCASSSRSRCRTRAPASSPCRTRCAVGCGAPRASSLRTRTALPAPSSSSPDPAHRALDRRLRRDVLRRREDRRLSSFAKHLAGERIEVRDRLDLVAEEARSGTRSRSARAAPR